LDIFTFLASVFEVYSRKQRKFLLMVIYEKKVIGQTAYSWTREGVQRFHYRHFATLAQTKLLSTVRTML